MTTTDRALLAMDGRDCIHQEELGRLLWPDAVGSSANHGSSHRGYPSLGILGTMRKAGLVRRVDHPQTGQSIGWRLTEAGTARARALREAS